MQRKSVNLFKSSVFLILGSAAAKFSPLIIGFLVSNTIDSQAYVAFVSFLFLSNLMISSSALGCGPQLLALKDDDEFQENCRTILFVGFLFLHISFVSLLVYLLLFGSNSESIISVGRFFFVYIYVLGMFLVYTSTAILNSQKRHRSASIIWYSYCLLTIFPAAILFFKKDIDAFFLNYGVMACIAGFYGLKKSNVLRNKVFVLQRIKIKRFSFGGIAFSSFGFLSSSVLYAYQSNLVENVVGEEAAYASLLFQIFAAVLFIPGFLGNISIPRMKGGKEKLSVSHIYGVYFFISFVAAIVVYYLFPYLAYLYHFESILNARTIVLFFLAAAVFASVHSFSIQRMVAQNSYMLLLKMTVLWSIFSFLGIKTFPVTLYGMASLFFISYLLLVILGILLLENKYHYGSGL